MHVKHLKPSPPASSIVDRCIECGFCESNCPSRDITLTPRQRITTYREISRLRSMPNRTPEQQQRSALLEQAAGHQSLSQECIALCNILQTYSDFLFPRHRAVCLASCISADSSAGCQRKYWTS